MEESLLPTLGDPLTAGELAYQWEEWATLPTSDLGDAGWAHNGLAILADGRLLGGVVGGGELAIYEPTGAVLKRWPTAFVEAHGIATDAVDGRIWVADTGFAIAPNGSGAYARRNEVPCGCVVSIDASAREVSRLQTPGNHPAARDAAFRPTAVAVDPNGAVWVADGYGQHLVHRFVDETAPDLTLSGEEGAGRFDCPHSIFVDTRQTQPRLYVADRGNARIQIYTLDGVFIDALETGFISPTSFATVGSHLVVAELHARLTVLGPRDEIVGHLGADVGAPRRIGWPNAVDSTGSTVRPPLRPAAFNSPHGLAADSSGNLYVSEWLVGGRIVALRRIPQTVADASPEYLQ
jgi:sugar lactone lactonase YvrE